MPNPAPAGHGARGGCAPTWLLAIATVVAAVVAHAAPAQAQSLDVGLGLGIPLQTFVEDEVGREFRVGPPAGYYPTLRERDNALGSFHLHLALVLEDYDILGVFDDIEIRFDFANFGWSQATVTHTACQPVETIDGSFDAATAIFFPIEDAHCIDRNTYDETTDISALELPALRVLNFSVGGRAHLLDLAGWTLWLSSGAGFVVATFADPGAEYFLGASLAAGGGVSYAISEIVSVKLLEARATFIITEASDSIQNRLNHDSSDASWIGTQLLETFTWVDFQAGLSFAF